MSESSQAHLSKFIAFIAIASNVLASLYCLGGHAVSHHIRGVLGLAEQTGRGQGDAKLLCLRDQLREQLRLPAGQPGGSALAI